MHSSLPLPLVVSSQALSRAVPLQPVPSTPRLSPTELAQAYRAWRFGSAHTASLVRGTRR
ncbi:hypothetical protein J2X48_004960 [Bosea sp. BE271]|nr:hypothetical protein [Bosea robiniae]MDR6897980.1 hypothetical protein [Bosea sp. BE109]MDR7141347.1 hypothetical protein [Bosea sp. BE168]MDR7178009.1 hypothetical protein [Bosea sp. BE271]